ncbi:hypothetical protein KUTeg_024328 [Tegillarca granosa]|uniref:Uncharacterized protein n=1 Tax=Tegillarca granosa TaxID=220873 RepID=A0ABQ9E1L9_TEGGR|nr:hypothetical protein KUTeg_024328 [Tegillarca granosa]
MSATWKTKAEEIIDRCENKPNQDEWMTVKRCLNKLQEDLKCFSEKYPEEAKKRKIQLNTRSSTMPNSDALKNDDVTTVVKYLKKAHTYHHDLPKPKAEAAMRDFSDMVDCLFYFKQIEQEQGKGKNVSVIDVQGGTAPSGTGGQQKDLDEIFSDSKKPKNVFDSEFSKTHNKNQTRGSKDNTLSKTLPPNLSKNEIPPKTEKQEGTTRTDREENKDEKERLINVADVRNKFQSDSLSKTVVHSKPANSPKPTTKSTGQTFSKTLPTTKQFKNGIQKDGEKLEIAEGGKEMEAGKKCENSAGDSKDNEFKQKIQELESKIKEMENKNKTLNETVNVTEKR